MLKLSTPNIDKNEIEAVTQVLQSGNLVYGQVGRDFESKLAEFTGSKEAIVVSSGTAAIHLSLKVLGIGPGDCVIVPGFTFPATANAVMLCGATPVFADVCPLTFCVTSSQLELAYNNWHKPEKIKAIIPVHEFGYPCDMNSIMEFSNAKNLYVIEDAACALGATHKSKHVGTFGATGCFSFHPRKSITTGEGGLITTNDTSLANELRILRNHGISYTDEGPKFISAGFNYRLSDIQSAIGREQLTKFPSALRKRKELYEIYANALSDTAINIPANIYGHSWQTFMVVLPLEVQQSKIIKRLKLSGIESNIGAQALLELDSYATHSKLNIDTPISKLLYKQGLALPFCELYEKSQLEYVTKELIKALG